MTINDKYFINVDPDYQRTCTFAFFTSFVILAHRRAVNKDSCLVALFRDQTRDIETLCQNFISQAALPIFGNIHPSNYWVYGLADKTDLSITCKNNETTTSLHGKGYFYLPTGCTADQIMYDSRLAGIFTVPPISESVQVLNYSTLIFPVYAPNENIVYVPPTFKNTPF